MITQRNMTGPIITHCSSGDDYKERNKLDPSKRSGTTLRFSPFHVFSIIQRLFQLRAYKANVFRAGGNNM